MVIDVGANDGSDYAIPAVKDVSTRNQIKNRLSLSTEYKY